MFHTQPTQAMTLGDTHLMPLSVSVCLYQPLHHIHPSVNTTPYQGTTTPRGRKSKRPHGTGHTFRNSKLMPQTETQTPEVRTNTIDLCRGLSIAIAWVPSLNHPSSPEYHRSPR
jgi:hypothetical protein